MNLARIVRHLAMPAWRAGTVFPATALSRIEREIAASERQHAGQIRFAVEASLDLGLLLRGVSARERAVDVFSQLRVWDTEHNNGVLIYLLLADHDVEIVADRGIDRRVGAAVWEQVCRDMEAQFRAGRFTDGVCAGIAEVGALLAQHYPADGPGSNELPDTPLLF